MRPTFKQIYMKLAFSLSERATCERRKVGAVITSIDYTHVFGIGYNGREKGGPNHCERPKEQGNCGCLHAEDNALLKCKEGPDVPKIFFVTDQPCEYCARRIVNKGGFSRVFYSKEYHNTKGIYILASSNILAEKLND